MTSMSHRIRLFIVIVAAVVAALAVGRSIRAADHRMSAAVEHPVDGQGESMMHGTDAMHSMRAGVAPSLTGQDAFGAIQEIVSILEADPRTDWSKVDLEALRQHLIDMHEVTINAAAAAKPIEGGLEIAVTGGARTFEAIRRMVPAHAQEIDGRNGWSVKSAPLANGVLLTVTASDPKEVAHIRGLGFAGILASGSHHRPHHLAMAKGEFPH